jgi:hypothetical protein
MDEDGVESAGLVGGLLIAELLEGRRKERNEGVGEFGEVQKFETTPPNQNLRS